MKLVNEVKFAGEHNKHAVLPYLKIDLDGSIHCRVLFCVERNALRGNFKILSSL